MGIMTLFGGGDDADGGGDFERVSIPDMEFSKRDRLAFEKEMLGQFVTDHPLLGVREALSAACTSSSTSRLVLAIPLITMICRRFLCFLLSPRNSSRASLR